MRHAHAMPFGASLIAAGGVRFRLWAPGVTRVTLQLEARQPIHLPMQAREGGWHELDVAAAAPGTRYRFMLPDGLRVPDPAARFNPDGVHGASEVIDPRAHEWPDDAWHGRPWEETVLYELHVGTFSPTGDFAGVTARLDYLADLGITALEIMPVAAFPGARNWGYDGVLPFAPTARYGRPTDFKRLIAAAHARGLMVFLDVVYNHFGPDGNYLHCYCPEFFNARHHTPWGAALNFDGAQSRTVRDFFIHNALYWLEEYRLDGLRLDAIHAICDACRPDIVEELRAAISHGPGRERHIHLILENDRNAAHYLVPAKSRKWQGGTAQWNDDFHHVLHVLASGESGGYYADYATAPTALLGRCLAEGFAFQGEPSPFRGGRARGEPSNHLPPAAFVNFLQTHDQVGNRALGERLCHLAPPDVLEALAALLLLAPSPPLIFMGEEFSADQPFLYFCDFSAELAAAVTNGRRNAFADPAVRASIPDPNAIATFAACVLDWTALARLPHKRMHALYTYLLTLRRNEIAPRLAGMTRGARVERLGPQALQAQWTLGDGSLLELLTNLGPASMDGVASVMGRLLFASPGLDAEMLTTGRMPPWTVAWRLGERPRP
jgi:malto-oligosyltrehalose trehalohydrolase